MGLIVKTQDDAQASSFIAKDLEAYIEKNITHIEKLAISLSSIKQTAQSIDSSLQMNIKNQMKSILQKPASTNLKRGNNSSFLKTDAKVDLIPVTIPKNMYQPTITNETTILYSVCREYIAI